MRTKNNMNGNSTKNQAIPGAPAPHIKFNTHVQNNIYNIFMTKIKNVLETLHVYEPTQYLSMFPKFCNIMTTNAIIDITK